MIARKILVACDGSDQSNRAIEIAKDIAGQDPTLKIVLAHAVKLTTFPPETLALNEVIVAEAMQYCEELETIAAAMPCEACVRTIKGSSPADLLLKCAEDEGCDLIIMGSRGRGGVKGYLGSVSLAVVQGSKADVIIAK